MLYYRSNYFWKREAKGLLKVDVDLGGVLSLTAFLGTVEAFLATVAAFFATAATTFFLGAAATVADFFSFFLVSGASTYMVSASKTHEGLPPRA